jgi:hypothetical protein
MIITNGAHSTYMHIVDGTGMLRLNTQLGIKSPAIVQFNTGIKLHEQFYVTWAKKFDTSTELDIYRIASSITMVS